MTTVGYLPLRRDVAVELPDRFSFVVECVTLPERADESGLDNPDGGAITWSCAGAEYQ